MPDDIGNMRERLVIKSGAESTDSEGNPVTVWSTLATVWGRAHFLSGSEMEAMQKINAEISLEFTIRYRTDLDEKMVINWRSADWNIAALLPDEEKVLMSAMVSKVR